MTTYNTGESNTLDSYLEQVKQLEKENMELFMEASANRELNIYQNAIRYVMATENPGEDRAADVILRHLNGHSNSLLLYEIRAGVNAIRASRSRLAINWERAWLN